MPGFIERFTMFPGIDVITEIEGIDILDFPAPSSITGVGSGVVAVIGEFLKIQPDPIEVRSSAEMNTLFGGYSENVGDKITITNGDTSFIGWDGNAFLKIKGKKFNRLVCVSVNDSVGKVTFTRSASQGFAIVPAGTVVKNGAAGTDKFETAQDAVFADGDTEVDNILIRQASGDDVLINTIDTFETTPVGDELSGIAVDNAAATSDPPDTEAEWTTLYDDAFSQLQAQKSPESEVSVVVSARCGDSLGASTGLIQAKLKQLAVDKSADGRGCIACISPPINTSKASALGNTNAGVGAVGRNERVIYCYPGIRVFTKEAFNDVSEGLVDITSDFSMASVLSQLAPERNPAQATDFMLHVVDIESATKSSGTILALTKADYKSFRKNGIAAPRIDASAGPIFQSGVTSVDPAADSGKTQIKRRRMADYIQDSLSAGLMKFSKELGTEKTKNVIAGTAESFLLSLLSPGNPSFRRISEYRLDRKSGNTDIQLAAGVFVLQIFVKTLPTYDNIVLQTEIGDSIVVTEV